ncbi:MAG: glutaredoxin family protein [Bacteroidales bacterium]
MKKVQLYTLSTCPWCKKAKKAFTDWGVPFDYIDYDLADMQTQDLIVEEMDKYGASGFPFAKIGNDVVMGYNPDRYAALLGI